MKKNEKKFEISKVIVFILLLILIFAFGCKKEEQKEQESLEFDIIRISEPGIFEIEECKKRDLEDKIIMIGSKYCGHCEKTKPDFIEACTTKDITHEVLDLAKKEDREKLKKYGLEVIYTPTFIFDCEYHIGTKTKKEYLNLCNKFLEE